MTLEQELQVLTEAKTVTQSAEILEITRQAVWYKIWHKKVKAVLVGKAYLIPGEEVKRLKEAK